MKTCSRCKRKLPLSEFYKDCWRKDGLKGYCRECVREKNKKQYYKKKGYKSPEVVSNQQDKEFNQLLGGYKIYILNHIKQGERKYNVVATSGKTWSTNNKDKFFEYLEAI